MEIKCKEVNSLRIQWPLSCVLAFSELGSGWLVSTNLLCGRLTFMFSMSFVGVYLCRLTFFNSRFHRQMNLVQFFFVYIYMCICASTPWEIKKKSVNRYFGLKCDLVSGFYTLVLIPNDTAVLPCVSLLCPFPQKTYLQLQWPKAQRSRFKTGKLLLQI